MNLFRWQGATIRDQQVRIAPGHEHQGTSYPGIVRLCVQPRHAPAVEAETRARRFWIEGPEVAWEGECIQIGARARPTLDYQVPSDEPGQGLMDGVVIYFWSIIAGSGMVLNGSYATTYAKDAFFWGLAGEVTVLVEAEDEAGEVLRAVKKIFVRRATVTIDPANPANHVDVNPLRFEAQGSHCRIAPTTAPVFGVKPVKVTIDVPAECPTRTDYARFHRVGWLQTVYANERFAEYEKGEPTRLLVDLPIRDAFSANECPYYDTAQIKAFGAYQGPGATVEVAHSDSPQSAIIAVNGGEKGPLRRLKQQNRFVAWLVVENRLLTTLSEHLTNPAVQAACQQQAFTFLWHWEWQCDLDATHLNAHLPEDVTHRVLQTGPGKGAHDPVLTAPIPNISQREIEPMLID